jgi:hypothetical protein
MLAAGAGAPQPRPAGDALNPDLPIAPMRSLDAYPGGRRRCHIMTTAPSKATKTVAPLSVPLLAADLDAGLRRLELAAIRRTAPEVLHTAETQRWTPEELLRTLVETELAARDASNVVNQLKAAGTSSGVSCI